MPVCLFDSSIWNTNERLSSLIRIKSSDQRLLAKMSVLSFPLRRCASVFLHWLTSRSVPPDHRMKLFMILRVFATLRHKMILRIMSYQSYVSWFADGRLDLWQFEFSITCVQSTPGHRSKPERPQAVYKSEGNTSFGGCETQMLQAQSQQQVAQEYSRVSSRV